MEEQCKKYKITISHSDKIIENLKREVASLKAEISKLNSTINDYEQALKLERTKNASETSDKERTILRVNSLQKETELKVETLTKELAKIKEKLEESEDIVHNYKSLIEKLSNSKENAINDAEASEDKIAELVKLINVSIYHLICCSLKGKKLLELNKIG